MSDGRRWALGRRSTLLGVIAATAIAAAGVAAGTAGGSTAADEVKIGLITSVSGPASVYYPSIKQVTQMAVDEINASGGVLGSKVNLVTADTKTTPAQAATQSRRLVQEGVKLMVVEDIVADRDAALPPTTQRNIPFIYAWSYEGGESQQGTDTVCVNNFWATGAVPNNLVPQPIAYLSKRGWKNWFLIGSDYKWPRTMNLHIARAIKANGGKVLGQEYVPLGTSEFTALVTKLKSLPKGTKIVNNLVGGDLIGFYKQWHAAGGNNSNVIAFAMDEQTLGATSGAAGGTWGSYDYYANRKNPGNLAWLKKLRAKYGNGTAVPTSLSEEGYEAIWLWALAARKARSFDLDKINKAFPQVSIFGPRDRVRFLPNRHMALPNILAVAGPKNLYTKFVKDFGVIAPANQCPPGSYK
jgi:ABC-type branched-subunit amino acid transport system substrate-binding protein